jgi:hypothetical protein
MGRPRSDARQAARAADIRSLRATNKLRHAKWWADDVDTILGRYSAAACGDRVAEAASASERLLLERLERLERRRSRSGAALLAVSHLLKLASPDAAEGAFIDEVLLSLHPEVDAALKAGTSLVDVPAGHALAQFLASARAAVAKKQEHPNMLANMLAQEAVSNIQLVILPTHVDAFTKKLEEFSSTGRPSVPCVAFHSTPHQDAWRGIACNNFDPEKCGRHDAGFYGRGTYFHTNVPFGGGGGSKTFLSLILKGVEYELNYRLGCPLEKGFDSHIAADRKDTGETVIFHQSQMIPVISYGCGYDRDDDAHSFCDTWGTYYDEYSEYDYYDSLEAIASTTMFPFLGDIWGHCPCPVCSSWYCNDCHWLAQAFDSLRNRCREDRGSRPRRPLTSTSPARGVNDKLHDAVLGMKLACRSWQRRFRRRAARSRAVRRASERHSKLNRDH